MNNNEFEKSFKEICLAELELKKENTSDNVAIFFYLKIKKSFLLHYMTKGTDLIFPQRG